MKNEVREAIEACVKDELDDWLDHQSDDIVRQVAVGAAAYGRSCEQLPGFPANLPAMNAVVGWLTSFQAFRRLGDLPQAIEAGYRRAQVLFMVASTVTEYASVRRQIAPLAAMSDEHGLANKSEQLMRLSADCAFFAAKASADSEERREFLVLAMEDILAAGRGKEAPIDERFPVLLPYISDVVRKESWAEHSERITQLLRELASLAERTIPVGYVYRDPTEQLPCTGELVALSTAFGDLQMARERRSAGWWMIKGERWLTDLSIS